MRTARKLTAVAASAALVVGGALVSAPVANAATISVTDANCVTSSSPPSNAPRITASPGDTLSFATGLTSCDSLSVGKSLVDSDTSITYAGGGTVTRNDTAFAYFFEGTSAFTSIQITLGSSTGSGVMSIYEDNSGKGVNWPIRISSSGGGGSTSSSSSAPAAWIQQFGRPASGTCEEAAPADLNLAGVGSGGWGESWAQWMNGGTGGAVCTRTLAYVGSSWTVS